MGRLRIDDKEIGVTINKSEMLKNFSISNVIGDPTEVMVSSCIKMNEIGFLCQTSQLKWIR